MTRRAYIHVTTDSGDYTWSCRRCGEQGIYWYATAAAAVNRGMSHLLLHHPFEYGMQVVA